MSPLSLKAGMTALNNGMAALAAKLSRASIVLVLYPDQLTWQLKHGGKSKAQGLEVVPLQQAASNQQALPETLLKVLKQTGVSACRVDVVLSSHFMRFAIVGNPDGARNSEELALLCRHAFERVHGDIVTGWDIRLSYGGIGQPGLASAVDQGLLDKLSTTLSDAGYQLGSVQPTLMLAFNRLAAASQHGLFALKEPGRLALLAWQQGGWAAVQLQPLATDWQAQVQASVARLQLQLGLGADTALQVASLDAEALDASLLLSPQAVPVPQQVAA